MIEMPVVWLYYQAYIEINRGKGVLEKFCSRTQQSLRLDAGDFVKLACVIIENISSKSK